MQRNTFLFTLTSILPKKVLFLAQYHYYCAIISIISMKISVFDKVIMN